MYIGIVGSEAKKFILETEQEARLQIMNIISDTLYSTKKIPTIVSGRCHLGGVDVWAEEAADVLKYPKEIFPPKIHSWEGGYKQRNIEIANASDIVYCITLKALPAGYKIESWNKKPCYHCAKRGFPFGEHVKSGGCWTAWYAIEHFKHQAKWIII